MKDENNIGLKKKVIISCSIALAAIIMIVCIILFAPLPMNIDWDSIYDIESNVKLLQPGEGGNATNASALVKMNADGTIDTSDWKILQFTDMHLSEKNKGDLGNDRTMECFINAIETERPDFVALTGDIITSIRGRARAVQLCEVMEKLGVYWAYCLGNHEGDAFCKLQRKPLMDIIEKYPHCLSEGSVKKTAAGEEVWGIGNFVVNLLGADHKVVQSLIFMDSGDAISKEDAKRLNVESGSYDYLKESQKVWFEEQVRAVTDDLKNDVKTMLFIHIPLVQQRNVTYVALNNEATLAAGWTAEAPIEGWSYIDGKEAVDHADNLVGKIAIKDGWSVANGSGNFEGVCSSDYDNKMYDLMKSLGCVNGLFCGHDHVNDSVLYETDEEHPIYLCYGICSGYATYNLYKNNKTDDPENLMKGYSIITVHSDRTFDYTGVRYDKGNARTAYVVNSLPAQD